MGVVTYDEPFPVHVLEGAQSALVLFAAAFNGVQDAAFVLDAEMQATCVDNDPDHLRRMEKLYPDDWVFVEADAFQFSTESTETWDVVTVDCPSNMFDQCADFAFLWCLRASKAVVLGSGHMTKVVAPNGWRITEKRKRSEFAGGVYWTVLERT